MHKKFTLHVRELTLTVIFAFFGVIMGSSNGFAQVWSGVYGNEWLDGQYNQPWVRLGVGQRGIQRVPMSSLPAAFQTADQSKLALWHRGKQVSIIKVDASEILFYGVPNDGASDALLYRLPVSRRNPHYSIYSDESAYFLTINPSVNGNRAITPTLTGSPATVAVNAHLKTYFKKYANEYSHSTATYYRPSSLNSYFEEGKQLTGTSIMGDFITGIRTSNPVSVVFPNGYTAVPFSFQVQNRAAGGSMKLYVHIKSRLGHSNAKIYVGPQGGATSQMRLLKSEDVSFFTDYDFVFDLQSSDLDASGNGTLGVEGTNLESFGTGSGFSVSFFSVVYDQNLDMQNQNSYDFEFPAASGRSTFAIANAPVGVSVYNITDGDVPQIISGSPSSLVIDRNGSELKLLVTNESIEIVPAKISTVTFTNLVPSSYDYLIVNSENLSTSAATYSNYRKTISPGKKYKPVAVNIKDIYNQFNYGEPSPVAIKRFVDYMISDNNKNKFLLLIGLSTTYYENSVREIPNEVPTIGFPGSDILLVDGLKGTAEDVPTIAVGRISARDNQQVLDYLAKLTIYESQSSDLAWRKKVVHMNGGKSDGEVTSFANYMSGISGPVTNSPFSGSVIPKIKTNKADVIEEMSLATELNAGLGMISYFGHGNYNKTDYNAGYVSEHSDYTNLGNRFPVLFYNGCGVNNIFTGLNDVSGNSKRAMSLDWLLNPRGAIVVFGNTWDAYASNSNEYLDRLYPRIFSQTDTQRKTIGEILSDVAQEMKTVKGYRYTEANNAGGASEYNVDRANIHQILLQGDPALRILLTDAPLPVKLISFDAESADDKVNLNWKTASEVNNGRFEIERSYNAKVFEKIGTVEGKGTTNTESSYSFIDANPLSGTSYYRLNQIDRITNASGQYVEGESTHSRIVSVTRDASNFFIVSPNPTTDLVNIKLNAAVEINNWEIIDIKGTVRASGKVSQQINLSGMEAGEYIIKIVTKNGDIYNKKVVRK